MAQVTYRGNLSAKIFPFIAEYFGPSVIVQGQDQNFQRQVVSSEDLDKDRGIPQVYYCHNVMPTSEGFESIGYTNLITDTKNSFDRIYTLRDVTGNEVFYAPGTDGSNYILPFNGTSWVQINTVPATAGVQITTASLNGQTFIYFANVGCYFYNSITNTLVPITLTGLDQTTVIGITSNSGYMIAWTALAIAWSSTIDHTNASDPIDFVPSLATGAGGGSVEAAKGKILLCVPHYLGFVIYTNENAVAAVYSGNSRFPFNLKEIVNSGGLLDPRLVSADSSTGNHYAYTTSGLQLVSVSQTQTIFPEITDFIGGKYFEDFDETTFTFFRKKLNAPFKKTLNVIADRYLVISYGVNSLTHALVYDTIQRRFGKLKTPHVNCFEWKQLGTSVEIPRQSIGFLQANGSISTVDFSYGSANSAGLMLLGKYQLMRSRTMQLDEVEIENIQNTSNFQLYNMVSLDGKNFQPPVLGNLIGDYGTAKRYGFRQTGINHTLIAKGQFYCSSIVLKFNVHGRR